MRRPALLALLLAIALFSVLYGKYRLDQGIKEGRFNTETAPAADPGLPTTIDLGVEPDPGRPSAAELPPHSAGDSHTDVMSALVEARQSFRLRDKVTREAAGDPHATPNSILKSAEKLGTLVTLEQAHPEYRPEFQAFYLDCSKDPLVITVTRVQCLEKFVQSKKPGPDDVKILLAGTDPVVAKLYLEMQP